MARKPAPDRVALFPYRWIDAGIRAAESPFPANRHRRESCRSARPSPAGGALPNTIARYHRRAPDRTNPERDRQLGDRPLGAEGGALKEDIGPWLPPHQIGIMHKAGMGGVATKYRRQVDRLLFGAKPESAIVKQQESRLDTDKPDLCPITVSRAAPLGRERGLVIDRPHRRKRR